MNNDEHGVDASSCFTNDPEEDDHTEEPFLLPFTQAVVADEPTIFVRQQPKSPEEDAATTGGAASAEGNDDEYPLMTQSPAAGDQSPVQVAEQDTFQRVHKPHDIDKSSMALDHAEREQEDEGNVCLTRVPPEDLFATSDILQEPDFAGLGGDQEEDEEDDDESDDDDSDDESDDDEISDSGPSLVERREIRIKRNQTMEQELGLCQAKKAIRPPRKQPSKSRKVEKVETTVRVRRGMKMPTTQTTASALNTEALYTKYPGRQPQIRLLSSLMRATIGQLDTPASCYVPPPIFITGPSGTAKTSLARDLIHSLQQGQASRVASAYINCATLEPSSIEALVQSAFTQISSTFVPIKHRKRKRQGQEELNNNNNDSESKYSNDRTCLPHNQEKEEEMKHSEGKWTRVDEDNDEEADYSDEVAADRLEDRIEQARAMISQPEQNEEREESETRNNNNYIPATRKPAPPPAGRQQYSRQSKLESDSRNRLKSFQAPRDKTADAETKSSASHGAPLAFGRSLLPFIGPGGRGCAFLVLDHAERIMQLSPHRTTWRHNTNYLSQLVLLPKALELNLSIIVISRNSLLMYSRIDNAATVDKSTGTISNGGHPIRVHFGAYSDNETLIAILKQPENLEKMIGKGYSSAFHQMLIKSFLSSFVQSICGVTRDINDMICAGRRLWLNYTEPLGPQQIDDTLKLIEGNNDVQKALLSHLDERMVKLSKNIEKSIISLDHMPDGSPLHDLPYLVKCLLLASFICQHNRADKDKQLFSIVGSGKRRAKQRDAEDNPESVAYATWDQQRLKALRPRSFPLERMLSIFVNLVGQQQSLTYATSTKDFIASLGSTVFLETISQLHSMGLIRETVSDDGVQLGSPTYCCDLSRDDANHLAQSISFPLDRYLVGK